MKPMLPRDRSIAFPKRIGWLILVLLVYFDAIFTVIIGKEGNPLWQIFTNRYGIWTDLIAPIPVLLALYVGILLLTPIVRRFDRYPNSHEVILTNLIIVYAIYDLYFILNFVGFPLAVDFFASKIKLIIALLVPGIIPYNIFLEYRLLKQKNSSNSL
ncbi:hypothetical protein HYW32_00375 [Candidatus Berkelbacteria bacterium]|nr:hypothetical protein [Candidatus Berkelbacteria bacterium]